MAKLPIFSQGFKIPQVRRPGLTNFGFGLDIEICQKSRDLALLIFDYLKKLFKDSKI
jgi:hypothetical protein